MTRRDRYYVRLAETGSGRVGRREWLNMFTCDWPYAVYFGQPYPSGTSLGMAYSLRKARKMIRKHRAMGVKRGEVRYEEEADGALVLPDLRVAMPVPDRPAAEGR